VRTKLREVDSDYDYTVDLCLRCFYRGFKGFREDPEKGFLQSSLLIKVCWVRLYVTKLIPYCKTFKHIFTSPSSSHDISILDNENDAETIQPSKKTRRTETGKKANTRKAVQMTRVTPRAIAYAAVQVLYISNTTYISHFL
jgi:hypothetical protein